MEYKDYYKILGVEKNATQDDIKSSFRKLARKYHPDINKDDGAEDEFKKISEANEVLGGPEKRAAYDQLGENWQQGQDFNPDANWDAGFEFSGGFNNGGFGAGDSAFHGSSGGEQFSDFFENLFGQAYAQQRQQQEEARRNMPGEDSHAKVLIDLEDSFQGTKKMVSLKAPELSPDGHVTLKERKLSITIPKGVTEGQHIRLKGQGHPAPGGGQAGDLYLEIAFNPHPFYHIEGKDISISLPVTPWEAALGDKVKVPTPSGTVDLKIPANAKQGQKMRLKGRGIPAKGAGDFYVMIELTLPAADSDEAKALYKTMAEKLDYNPRKQLGV